jgi:hypothetical protein
VSGGNAPEVYVFTFYSRQGGAANLLELVARAKAGAAVALWLARATPEAEIGDDAFLGVVPSHADQARFEAIADRRRRAKKVERTVTVIP